MGDSGITEAATVQFPMVRHAAEVGWTPLTSQEALARRGGASSMLFRGDLEAALRRFNPWMTADAVRSTIERLEALPPTIEGNRDVLAWLRGERQGYDEAEQRHRPVRLIDFDTLGANGLHVTWEWTAKPPTRQRNRADDVSYAVDLARKTHSLVAESATQDGLGYRAKAMTFDLRTLAALRNEPGAHEAKVFNLVRGLQQEIANEPDRQPVLLPLKERADRVLKDLAERALSGLEAMEQLAVLAREKETAVAAAQDSGLSARAFSVNWALKDDDNLRAAGIATLDLAQRAEALLDRFPNAAVNADEQRRLRATLYFPLLDLDSAARSRVVERIVAILLGTDADADARRTSPSPPPV